MVVDNTSAFRMDADTPLVVPEVNPEAIKDHSVGALPFVVLGGALPFVVLEVLSQDQGTPFPVA